MAEEEWKESHGPSRAHTKTHVPRSQPCSGCSHDEHWIEALSGTTGPTMVRARMIGPNPHARA